MSQSSKVQRQRSKAIVIRPGQHVVVVDSKGARRKMNKTSLTEALLGTGGLQSDQPAYLVTGPIMNVSRGTRPGWCEHCHESIPVPRRAYDSRFCSDICKEASNDQEPKVQDELIGPKINEVEVESGTYVEIDPSHPPNPKQRAVITEIEPPDGY